MMRCGTMLLVLGALLLSGCFQVDTVVTVNPDGSGTVEERVMMRQEIIAQFEQMLQGMAQGLGAAEAGAAGQLPELFSETEARQKAAKMGAGVELLNYLPLNERGFQGYRAIYWVEDVNQLTLNQDKPTDSLAPGEAKDSPASPFRFRLTQAGERSRLQIWQPQSDAAPAAQPRKAAAPAEGELSAEDQQKLQQMFAGMRFCFDVVVNGSIAESNATHQNGRRITVFSLEPGAMFDDPSKLQQLSNMNPESMEQMKQLAAAIPGLKVDLNERIEVVFGR